MWGVSRLSASVEEYYEWLIRYYSRWYSNPADAVERLLEDITRKHGFTRDEAVLELYGRIYPYLVGGKIRVLSLFNMSWQHLKSAPYISIPVLMGEAVATISSAVFIVILVLWLRELGSLAFLDEIFRGNLSLLLNPHVLVLSAKYMVSMLAVFFLASLVGGAVEDAFLLPIAKEMWTSGRISFGLLWKEGSSAFKRVLAIRTILDLVLLLPPLAFLGYFAYEILVDALDPGGMKAIVVLPISITGVIYFLVIKLFTIFSVPLVVVEPISPWRAIARSANLVWRNLGKVVAYLLTVLLLYCAMFIVIAVSTSLHFLFSEFASIIMLLVIKPISGLALMGLYLSILGRSLHHGFWSRADILSLCVEILGRGIKELSYFLKEEKPYLLASSTFFLFSALLGILSKDEPMGTIFVELIKRGAPGFKEFLRFSFFTDIFFHNWKVATLSAVSGIYTPIGSLLVSFINGYMLGLIATIIPLGRFLVGILPHGIIEIPSFVMALSAGLRLGWVSISRRGKLKDEVKRAVLVSVGLAPFFLAAAFVEAFVTPELLAMYGG